jgi:hypothetical protein
MTTRYGQLFASFWEWDDSSYTVISTPAPSVTYLEAEAAEVVSKLGQMARGRFTVPMQDNWEFFLVEGRIVSLYQYDKVTNAHRDMGAILMEKVRPKLGADGKMKIEVSGLGREKLLTRYRHWAPIGEQNYYVTAVATTAPAPWTTTVSVGAPAGNDHVIVANEGAAEVGDVIRIEMENSAWFVGRITDIEPPGAAEHTVVFEPRLPYSSFAGRDVEFRKARIVVADVTGMATGLEIQILLDSTSIHQTLIEEVDLEGLAVTIAAGLPSASTAGKQVTTYDYSQPATDDVTQIMARATGWEVEFDNVAYEGTENGTAHQPEGESVWELLTATAEQSGEFFRAAALETGHTPRKKIEWHRTNDSSGMTLILYSTTWEVETATENPNLGVIHEIERETEYNVVTRVYPSGADGRISLAYATDAALAEATAAGFAVGTDAGLWGKDYVQYSAGVTAHGVLSEVARYGNLTLSAKGAVSELQAAADSMLRQAMATILESQEREYWRVKAHMHRPLYPGQTVTLQNTAMAPETGGNVTMYVLEVREVLERGVIMTHLVLSKEAQRRPTAAVLLGRQLLSAKQAAFRPTTSDRSVVGAVVVGGGGGSGTSDHGALTGLGDDDHPQYLLASGARTLTGNLAVGASVTIDGVDLSAHAADPNAHHAQATAGNTAISVTGQAVSVELKTDPGLLVSSGLGMGTPSTLTAATTNAVSGSNHSHAITATSNAKSTVSTLLKGDANGDLTGRYFTLDKLISPEVETSSGDITIDPASGKTVNDGNLEFTGARSVTTSSGSLTLAPVSDLILDPASDAVSMAASATLKTGNWSSGFLGTGWGVTYAGAADFRSIYADELHVAAFIADTARVKVGAEYITPSMAIISRNFTIPAVSGTGTLYVEDAPGLDDTAVFNDNDYILLRIIDRPAGGLNVLNVWGQVTGYSNLTDGEQSWTFTTRSAGAAAVGEAARRGGVALDFGKAGDGWIWLTTLDATGSPYMGITTWQGSDPYTEGNRTHRLRLGQLSGVSGMHEWGLQSGAATSSFIRFSDVRSEIHGTRLSLYNGDTAYLKVGAARVQHYRTVSDVSNITPNADHTALSVIASGANAWDAINESPASVDYNDYVCNAANSSGIFFAGLTNPTWGTTTHHVNIDIAVKAEGFTNDTINLYCQVFDADELTPLTSEILVYTATANNAGTRVTEQFPQHDASATQTQWNAARLRFRWEYVINVSEEVIRLDPNVPSIAVGSALPTGYGAGGDGFWVGRDTADGVYKMRLGEAAGAGMRWTGSALTLNNDAGNAVITLNSSGTSEFTLPMTLGTGGGIYQGTGDFTTPTAGLKLWNSSGQGYLSTFEGGGEQIRLHKDGLILGSETTNFARRNAITFAASPSDTPFAGIYANSSNAANSATKVSNTGLYFIKNGTDGRTMIAGGTTYFVLDSSNDYALLENADLYIKESGVAVGYNTTPALNRGQIASDLSGEHDFNALVLQDTSDISHGMTSIVGGATYGALGKEVAASGGLKVIGASEATIGLALRGYSVSPSTDGTKGVVYVDAAKRNSTGPNVTSLAAGDDLFTVANNGAQQLVLRGDGDLYINDQYYGFDAFNDVALLRAADLAISGYDIDAAYGDWLEYNRDDLERLGLRQGRMTNVTRMQRLITGAVWQLAERVKQLEGLRG